MRRDETWAARLLGLARIVLGVVATLTLAAIARGAEVREPAGYPHGRFRDDCALCHGPDAWTPVKLSRKFDHARFGFSLTGAHAAARCTSCHASLDFTRTQRLCVTCHEDPHRGEMGTDCASCHTARSFIDRAVMLRAHQLSRFPLTGAHSGLDCESCHPPAAQGRLQYANTEAECSGCHMADYRAAKTPDHAASGFPLACRDCHSTLSWNRAAFDHAATRFPLTGAHRAATCQSCHGDGVYAAKSTACYSCHRADYDGTAAPSHAVAGYGTQCETCHTTTSWAGASFNHDATAFPLTGAHRTAACQSCHGDGVYAGKSTACYSCHTADYAGTADPPHAAAGFGTQCQTCHGTTSWAGASFNHDATAFPLTGAHRTATCQSCHGDGVYAGKSTACYSCHTADYAGTTDPAHAAAGFGTDCATCHSTTTWAGATFDHDASFFPIYSGTHRSRWSACNDCHTSPANYAVFTCLSCHPHDDQTETDSHHRGMSGYRYESSACYSCHPRGRS